jgi:hypothetical protein
LAGEGLDHHIGGISRLLLVGRVLRPAPDGDAPPDLQRSLAVGFGAQAAKGVQIIDPEANRLIVFGHQLPCQAPGHTDVAEVIDNAAKNIPANAHARPAWTRVQ